METADQPRIIIQEERQMAEDRNKNPKDNPKDAPFNPALPKRGPDAEPLDEGETPPKPPPPPVDPQNPGE